jgi:hypothetical protein
MLLRLWLEILSDTDSQIFSGSFAERVQIEPDSVGLAEQKMNVKTKYLSLQRFNSISGSVLIN